MTAEPSNSANGAMLSPSPPMIEVFSGGFVDLYTPDPDTLRLEDVARGMAYACRYSGQIRRFYSVAEHALLVHDLVRWMGGDIEGRRGALFHDAPEGLLHDVTAPLKWALRRQTIDIDAHYSGPWPPHVPDVRSAYDLVTLKMEHAMCRAFDLVPSSLDSRTLRVADMWALRIEARELSTSGGAHWRWPGELPNGGRLPDEIDWFGGLDPDDARLAWLDGVAAIGGVA